MKIQVQEKEVAYSWLTVKTISEDKRTFSGMATTPETDRMGDVVEPMGAKFAAELPLLWMHDHSLPVGTVKFGKPTKNGIPFTASIPEVPEPAGLKARLDEAWQSVKTGLIAAVSIGFRPLEYSFMDGGGIHFTESEIFELSLVTVPANAGAKITNIKSLFNPTAAGDGKMVAGLAPVVKTAGASAPKQATHRVVKVNDVQTKEPNMKYADTIKNFRDTLKVKMAAMDELMAANAGETLDADAQTKFDELEAEVKSVSAQIKRLETMESLHAAAGSPVTTKAGESEDAAAAARGGDKTPFNALRVKAAEKMEKGIEFARYIMCMAKAKGDVDTALKLAKKHYSTNTKLVGVLDFEANGATKMVELLQTKATVPAGTTLDSTWAAPLVDYQDFAGDFVEFLRPQTIIGQFGVGSVPAFRRVPFNINIKGQTSAASAQWVGEGAPKPLTKMDFNDIDLRWAKIAAIAVLTEELMRFSNPSAERLVRDELARAVIERMDVDFVNPAKAAVANVSPASITYGVTLIVASAGADAEDIRCDLQKLWAPFIAARNPARQAAYIMDSSTALFLAGLRNPLGQREFPTLTVNGGDLDGTPVVVSDYLPRDTAGGIIILVNASDIWLSDDGDVVIDASREASLQMLDNPTNNSASGTATSMVSMFQTNSVAIRAERMINWAKRRASAVQFLNGVNWGCA